jgi:NADH-quinone oxidoreductase subunit L
MPATFITFMCGSAALSGLPLLSGFFSKDEILAHTFAHGGLYMGIWALGVATAALTAFYTWRMVALTFFGKERFDAAKTHPHESPIVMTLPLMVLAVLSVFGGLLGLPPVFHVAHALKDWLEPVTRAGDAIIAARGAHVLSHEVEWALLGLGSVVAIVFATLGFKKHVGGTACDESFAATRGRLHAFLSDAWTIDTKYTHWIVQPVKLLAFVIAVVFDQFAIDGLVNGVAATAKSLGERTRRLANGKVASYGLWMGAVTAILVLVLIWNR